MWYYHKPLEEDSLSELKKVEEKYRSFSGPKSIASAFIEDATLVQDFDAEKNVAEIVRNLSPIIKSTFEIDIDLEDYLAFIVRHTEPSEIPDLNYHVDESHITIDICIGDTWKGGELVFDSYLELIELNPQPNYVAIFPGDIPHTILPVYDGQRISLIIWCRQTENIPRKFYDEYRNYLAKASLDPKHGPIGFTVPSLFSKYKAGVGLEILPRDVIFGIFSLLDYKVNSLTF